MSRRSRKRFEYIADWLVADSVVAGWFWPEVLSERQRRKHWQKPHRLAQLQRVLRSKRPPTDPDGLPF